MCLGAELLQESWPHRTVPEELQVSQMVLESLLTAVQNYRITLEKHHVWVDPKNNSSLYSFQK